MALPTALTGNALTGYGPQLQQIPRISPQQMGFQNQSLQQALSLLQGGALNKGFDFAPIANEARRQFHTQTVPSIAERFSNLGAQKSSAFQGALGSAASGLESNLAAQQAQFGLQSQGQQQNLLNLLSGLGMQPQFENILRPETTGILGGAAGGIGQGLGLGASLYGTGKLGSLLGGAGSAAASTAAPVAATGTGAGIGALSSLGALGPVGAGIGGTIALMLLLNYLARRGEE